MISRGKIRVLWIEDNARTDMYHLAAPVLINGNFKLDIAADATEALDYLSSEAYDAIIVDIRIPPGSDKRWHTDRQNPFPSKLGLNLLEYLFDNEETHNLNGTLRVNLLPSKFGILTVEGLDEIKSHLLRFNINVRNYKRKNARILHTALLDLIKQILNLE